MWRDTFFVNLGRHCCLYCDITYSQMQVSKMERQIFGTRTLESLKNDFQSFMLDGGNIKRAKLFNNVISEPLFNVPIDQV